MLMELLTIWHQEKIAHNHAKLIICNFNDFDSFNLSCNHQIVHVDIALKYIYNKASNNLPVLMISPMVLITNQDSFDLTRLTPSTKS